jgi:hypothetical protein
MTTQEVKRKLTNLRVLPLLLFILDFFLRYNISNVNLLCVDLLSKKGYLLQWWGIWINLIFPFFCGVLVETP